MTHSQLVNIAHKLILRNKFSCGIAFKEQVTTATSEIPDVIGFGGAGHWVLIEVKVSRSDFKRNVNKLHRSPMGRYRFFCVPTGLVTIEELPNGWGLIEVNENGRLHSIYNPFNRYLVGASPLEMDQRVKPHATCPVVERNFLYSMLRKKNSLY